MIVIVDVHLKGLALTIEVLLYHSGSDKEVSLPLSSAFSCMEL